MKVLVACEFSGVVREAFRARGYDARSCDLLPSEQEGPHYQCDVLTLLDLGWDLMIAHPPCTYLTNAGVRHLHDHVASKHGVRTAIFGAARWIELGYAAQFFCTLKNAPIPRICVENPIPHRYARAWIGYYDQLIQPWQFGHGETKATCLWLKGLPKLVPTNIVEGRDPKCFHTPQSPERWKIRSRTYQGIADAMADQWGSL